MACEWRKLCQADDLVVDEPHVEVVRGAGSRMRVTVRDEGDAFALTAVVARPAVVSAIPDMVVKAWLRNRATPLVGFRTDDRGRLIGEAWVPKAGLSPGEFQCYVRTVANECDRFEYMLTGRDPD